jgi:hypothetical protein
MRQVAWLFLNTLSVSGAVGNLGYHLLHREAALDLLEEAAEAVFEAYFGQGGGARPRWLPYDDPAVGSSEVLICG